MTAATTNGWSKVTDHAGWEPRDSQGELVFNGRMWMLGGWTSSFEPCLRDVWSSADGRQWQLVLPEAPWRHGDLPMTTVHNERMWFMGGWYNGRLPGHSASHEVWSSIDGVDWELVTEHAAWSPRLAAGLVSFKGRMWLLGGSENYFFGDDQSLRNDVWASEDGATWSLVTAAAPWSPRAYHRAVVHDDRIWVLGGGNYVPTHHACNDVWSSADGIHWEQATAAAPWGPRLWFRALAWRGYLWLLGGWAAETDNYGDVWYSRDGSNWTQLVAEPVWKARHEHAAFVFDDKLWVAGGHARPLTSDVWCLPSAAISEPGQG